ncbi:unnamed protein product [Durusdinium trenchii]|uniref:Uncharacterized protein n=1 Tax=Durusdinium trenchii TaxID=1381693 RepID=A0ABP0LYW4_9DINO
MELWYPAPSSQSLDLPTLSWAPRRSPGGSPHFAGRASTVASAQVRTGLDPRARAATSCAAGVLVLLALRASRGRQVARHAGFAQQPRLPRHRWDPEETEMLGLKHSTHGDNDRCSRPFRNSWRTNAFRPFLAKPG